MTTEPPRLDDLDELRLDVRQRARLWLETLRWLPEPVRGLAEPVVLETRRTPERQDWLYASGRTRPGPIVTHLRGDDPRARHVAPPGEGRAFDFAWRHPTRGLWDERHPWELAGVIAEQLGFRWGGRWTSPRDLGHIQDDRASADEVRIVLRRGSRGPRVLAAQRALLAARLPVGLVDGLYGPRTEQAVREYQADRGLPVTGEVDFETATALGIRLA